MYVLANRDVELSCDAWVIRMMGEKNRSSYALMLINMEERRNGMSALYSHFGKNAISERIEAIMKFKKTSTIACALALLVVVGATAAFAVGSASNEVDSNAPDGYVTDLSNEPTNQETGPTDVDSSLGELVAVNKSDESKFTAEEWEEILLKVESGDILFFDTREEVEYFSHR